MLSAVNRGDTPDRRRSHPSTSAPSEYVARGWPECRTRMQRRAVRRGSGPATRRRGRTCTARRRSGGSRRRSGRRPPPRSMPTWLASDASHASTSANSCSCSARVPLRTAWASSPTSSASQATVAGMPRWRSWWPYVDSISCWNARRSISGPSVGVRGFEPPASTSRTWRANQAALHPVAADEPTGGAPDPSKRIDPSTLVPGQTRATDSHGAPYSDGRAATGTGRGRRRRPRPGRRCRGSRRGRPSSADAAPAVDEALVVGAAGERRPARPGAGAAGRAA